MPTLTIDDIKVEVPEGTTMLEAARQAGVEDPDPLLPRRRPGHRRLPRVPRRGRGRHDPGRLLRAAGDRGHGGQDQHRQVRDGRQTVVELLLSEHDGDCQTCDRSADCELRSLADELGIGEIRYEGEKTFKMIDDSTPALVRDTGKCVACRRCVTVCNEIQGVGGLFAAEPRLRHRHRPGVRPGPERRRLRAVRPVRRRVPGGRHHRAQPDRRGLGRARRSRPST